MYGPELAGFSVILQNCLSRLPDGCSKSKHDIGHIQVRERENLIFKNPFVKVRKNFQECPSKASEDMSLARVVSHDLPKLIVKKKKKKGIEI